MAAENQASYFFFGNYSSRPSKNFRSVYEDIPALCDFEPSNSPLIYIVKALGLAGLSCHTETSGMEVAARAWYDKALQKINSSLRDRELVKGDQTLLVVLLFGLYEVCITPSTLQRPEADPDQTNTCNTPRSMKYWLNHVNGAAALLALRGEEQLDSEFGRTLFIHTRTQIVSACYQTRSSIPAIVVQLSQKCHDRNADPVESLIPIIFQFCNIRAEILFHPPTTQSESTTRATVTGYKSIAQALADWQDRIPVGFLPLTVSVGQASFDILSEHYNVYEDIWTAGIANNYRATSILVHEALISQLHFLRDYYAHSLDEVLELEDQILHSRNILLSLIDTVCASVPCLLRSNFAAAGVGLIWALYVSAQISPGVAPLQDATRRWIIGRLENIGAAMGVCQATMLAGFLRKRVEVMEVLKDEWAEGGGEGG